jgi:transposase
MAELFGLRISEGAIANALRRVNRPLDQAAAAIVERLRQATVIGCDETGARLTTADLGTRMGWEWGLVSDTAVLHRIHPSRGREVITAVLGEHRPRCWVSDRWSAQQGHADTHQVCLAHVLRDVQYAVDAGEVCFAPALRRLLCWAIAVGRRRPDLKNSTLAQYRAKAERRLDHLLALPTLTEAGAEVRRQTKRWRSQFFTFLTDRAVPPTNNASEQALRPSVILRPSRLHSTRSAACRDTALCASFPTRCAVRASAGSSPRRCMTWAAVSFPVIGADATRRMSSTMRDSSPGLNQSLRLRTALGAIPSGSAVP